MLDESSQRQGPQICHHLGPKCSCESTQSAEGGEERNVKMSLCLVTISHCISQHQSIKYARTIYHLVKFFAHIED